MDSTKELKKQVDLRSVPPQTERKFHISFNIILLSISIGFGILTFFAKSYAYFPIDLVITKSIQQIDWPFFKELMLFMTYIGNRNQTMISIAVVTISLLLFRKTKEALIILISSLGIVTLSESLKIAVGRPRPDSSLINQLGTFTNFDSFPSGHVLFAIGFYGVILYLLSVRFKKTIFANVCIGLLLLVIVLMGLSRIYVGAHWFSDTLGSYLIGFIWLSSMAFVYHKVNKT